MNNSSGSGFYKVFSHIILFSLAVTALCSCSTHTRGRAEENLLAYHVEGESLLARNSPTFVIERPEDDWNKIASTVIKEENQVRKVGLDSNIATIYAETRRWSGRKGNYTNLIYRAHFTKTPFRLVPFNLSAGKNVGLLVIITLDSRQQPLLITTVHTCGCYLAFIPTSHLNQESWPQRWQPESQRVFGETLPGLLTIDQGLEATPLILFLRESTHRVKDVRLMMSKENLTKQLANLQPMHSLNTIASEDGTIFSFYETEGSRKDYVVDSHKIWERLLISWWAFDWRVGEDKRLGADTSDGIVFYTSLKPWARTESDMRDFAKFLEYWGWKL